MAELSGDRGTFLSFLDWIDRPGQAVRNLLRGEWGSAGRQLLDFVGEVPDALLPGNVIPDATREQDYVSGGELVGLDEPGLGKFAGDVGVGILTDPITYIPGANIAKWAAQGLEAGTRGSKAAGTALLGADRVGEIGDGLQSIGRGVRSVFGAQRLSDEARGILDRSKAASQGVRQAGMAEVKRILGEMPQAEREIVGDVLDDVLWRDGAAVGKLSDQAVRDVAIPGAKPAPRPRMGALDRIDLHPGVTPENRERIRAAVQAIAGDGTTMGASSRQAGEGLERGIFADRRARPETRAVDEPGRVRDLGIDERTGEAILRPGGLDEFDPEYLHRVYSGQSESQAIDAILGTGPGQMRSGAATAERQLGDATDIADYLAKNPKVRYERDALVRMGKRAEQQGTLAGRASIGRDLLGKDFAYADAGMRQQVENNLREMAKADPESAKVLLDAFKGLAPRSAPMEALSQLNRYFKPFAVYGAFIPKFGSIVRNRVSGAWQALSEAAKEQGIIGALADPAARAAAGGQLRRMGSDLIGAIDDGLHKTFGWKRLTGSGLTGTLDDVEAAIANSGGVMDDALQALRQAGKRDAAELLESGVLQGFTRSEDLVAEVARTPFRKTFNNLMDWPGTIFRGVEDRMRAGMYLDLRKAGKSREEAARFVSDALYDYGVSSAGNRAARDVIPFFQFAAKAIPQQAQLLARNPAVAVGLAGAIGQHDEPVMPYMEGKLNIPLGEDSEGNAQYLSGLGLPFESLGMIPSSGRDIERGVIGSSHPLLKTAYGLISGEDPYFDTPFGAYGKVPVAGELGDAGRAYNLLAGAGLLGPIDAPLRQIDQALDSRQTPALRALDLLTGADVVSVDPDRALQMRLSEYLSRHPDVQQSRNLYSRSDDPEVEALLQELRAAKGRVRKKREAAKASAVGE